MKRRPEQAWIATLPVALALPAACWAVGAAWIGKPVADILFLTLMQAIVHIIAYGLTGLPIFLLSYRNPASPIWMLPFALVVGPLIGALTVALIAPQPVFIIAGAAYGLFTAIAAWLQRPRHHENTHHLP
ncbi:MAG: hypothetical protein KF712_05885 [Akkermansiaceae bacterium]|nr:hypothetical protein [Akkermansiaceae bacterium]